MKDIKAILLAVLLVLPVVIAGAWQGLNSKTILERELRCNLKTENIHNENLIFWQEMRRQLANAK